MQVEGVIRVGLSTSAASLALAMWCQTAVAGDWDISPTMSVEELFTDNVDLSQTDRKADFISVVRPGISVERTGAARSHFSLDFSFEYSRYLRDSNRTDRRKYLEANAGAEIFEDVFFVDGMASISQATISATRGESATEITDQGNRTEVVVGMVNPNLRHHFGNWADYRLDYELSNVRNRDDVLDTTVTQQVRSTLTSGREFSFLRWTAETSASNTDYTGSSRTNERRLAQVSLQYVDRILFQPTASIGYEKIDDNSLVDQPDGLIWSLGGVLEPGPRMRVQFSYGRRYGDPNTSLDASYELGPRTTISAGYSEVLETSQSLSLAELAVQNPGLTRQDSGFSLTNNAFRQSEFTANLNAERGRNTYRLEARRSVRETEAEGSTTTVNGANAEWQRALTRELNGSLNLGYRNTKTEALTERTDDLVTVSVQLDYQLQSDLVSGIGYTGTRRISTDTGSSYTENAVTLSLTAQF